MKGGVYEVDELRFLEMDCDWDGVMFGIFLLDLSSVVLDDDC